MHPVTLDSVGDPQAQARVGQVIAGKYRLERLLGAGGMGAVYAAKHEFTKRNVAVKLMHEAFAKSAMFAERFIREAQAPSAIGHAGIVDVLDGGVDESGALYLVLEMLQGKTLGDLETPLSVPDLVDVTVQLLDALGAAHKAGFVHRDIKPDNVFLTHDATGKRKVKLLDFGVAGLRAGMENNNLTQTGTILGTPTFMSPEQAKGDRVDQRSDLWAVGAILYDALAGRPPYDADTYNAVIVSIVTREHMPLERIRPDLPRRLLEVIELALRKDPAHRWQSAAEMIAALNGIPNLEALSGVVTKHAPPDAVAATAVARRAAPKAESVAAPDLTRPRVDDEKAAAPSPAARPSVGQRPARRVTTVTADETASAPNVVLWIGGATLVIALAVGGAWMAKTSRSTSADPGPAAGAAPDVTPTPASVAPATTATAATATGPSTPAPPEANPITPAAIAPAVAATDAPAITDVPALAPLSSNDLSSALAAGQTKLQRCYQDHLAAILLAGGPPPSALSLNVTLNVLASGEVRDVRIEGAAPDTLLTCMRGHLRAFSFRASSQATELNFPVVFQPAVVAP